MHKDWIIYASQYLTNREKIYLSMTSTSFCQLKYAFTYNERVDVDAISYLPYYDNFTSISANRLDQSFPKRIEKLYLTIEEYLCDPIEHPVPSSVTDLTLILPETSSFDALARPINSYITNYIVHFTLHLNTEAVKRVLHDTPIQFTCTRQDNPEMLERYPASVMSVTTYMCC